MAHLDIYMTLHNGKVIKLKIPEDGFGKHDLPPRIPQPLKPLYQEFKKKKRK